MGLIRIAIDNTSVTDGVVVNDDSRVVGPLGCHDTGVTFLLLGLKVALADAADGAYPVVGDVLKRCSSGDTAIGISYCGVVDVTANFANVLHKLVIV